MDNLQGYKPWARWLMPTRMWWLVLVMHALCSPFVILLGGIIATVREGCGDYIRLFGEISRARASFKRKA